MELESASDLNRILCEYIFQRVCAITDPEKTANKLNLSTNSINAGLASEGLLSPEIEEIRNALDKYRLLVVDARNKLISHLDLEAVLASAPLGAHTQGDLDAFYENLQKYCDEVSWALNIGALDFRGTACKGDAVDLMRLLQRAAAANQSFSRTPNGAR